MTEDWDADAPIRQHVRRVLEQIRALNRRLWAQEQARRAGSLDDGTEVDGKKDHPGGIDDV